MPEAVVAALDLKDAYSKVSNDVIRSILMEKGVCDLLVIWISAVLYSHRLSTGKAWVLILSRAPNTPKLSASFKKKGQSCETGLHLFCLKENCLPQLCQVVSEMQTREPESHLAVQLVNENNCGLQKTMLLWLETNTASCMTVNILSETLANAVNDSATVLELRTLMTINQAIQCGKEILDLIQRIKLLNPKVQLLFSLRSLTLVEFDLCDTSYISCGIYDIYCGQDLFLGKSSSYFMCQTMKVKCSRRFEFPKKDGIIGTPYLTCIACFVPISAAVKTHPAEDGYINAYHQKQEIRGQLRIQVYGPANLPLDMKDVTRKLTLNPHSLLPWQRLGLQVKKSFSCSSYDMHCSAKFTHREYVPSWAKQCHHFYIVLAFILNEREDFTEDNVFYRLYRHQESFRDLEQQTLNRTVYSTYQEAAWSCMEDLLSQDKQKSKSVKCSENNIRDCQVDGSELFKKMIPDVVNSLTDIFIRSTCVDFRSQVGALVPTSSRSSLSCHLETSLWKVLHKSGNNSDNPATPDQTISNPEESQVDDWEFSEDSLLSDEHCKALSPDSLDLDWDNAQSTIPCEDNASNNHTTSLSHDVGFKVAEIQGTSDVDGGCSFHQFASLSQSFGSYLSPEQEFDQWEMPGDFFSSTPIDTCTSNTNSTNTLLSPVFQQATTEYQSLHSAPCPEELRLSTLRFEHISSTNSTAQTTKTVTNASTALTSNFVDKLPRKRSSEYIDDGVSLAHDDVSCDNFSPSDDILDSKRQRCQNYSSIGDHSLSLQKVPTAFCSDDQDSFVMSRSGLKELDCNEEIQLKHFAQVEDDTSSSCWFDEEDIAKWYAELEK